MEYYTICMKWESCYDMHEAKVRVKGMLLPNVREPPGCDRRISWDYPVFVKKSMEAALLAFARESRRSMSASEYIKSITKMGVTNLGKQPYAYPCARVSPKYFRWTGHPIRRKSIDFISCFFHLLYFRLKP